ncbi:MAG: T9SS type A sorting domain-containing protein [Calditrichia bacterium]
MKSPLWSWVSRLGILFMVLVVGFAFAQQNPVGGPYTPDDNTMMLLHFDGDMSNVSQFSKDGVMHGNESSFFYLPNSVPNMGQCLRIQNDSKSDSAYVTVDDTSYLDLTGDWTIEGWINIFTFGTGSSDWRWVPRLVIKTGDEVFWQPNYFVEMWGDNRLFSCGYMAASQDQWPQANTPSNLMEVGKWYHMAFIRDTNRHLLMTVIHKYNDTSGEIELASFSVSDYLSFGAADPTPITTNQPVHIGYAGGGEDSFLDGFVDEVRISNVVREMPIPPIVKNVTSLSNQTTEAPDYEVGANIFTLFASTSIQSAKLYYSIDGGNAWTDVDMTTVSGDSMMAVIPKQPLGTVVQYYIEAIDNNGLTFNSPKDAGWQSADYYSFGVYQPVTQALDLTFEEGSGTPVDYSDYANSVTMYGTPEYSSNAAAGSDYSIYLEGDSSFLEVPGPFLAAKEFLVDFWMYPDYTNPEDGLYCRILNRPRNATSWSDNNYQIRFDPDSRLYAGTDGSVVITLDDSVEMHKWYHVMYEVRAAEPGDTVNYYAVLRLLDENDEIIEQKYAGFDNPVVEGFQPLRIGKAASPDTGTYPPFFKGNFDNVKIYNYPFANLPLENITAIGDKKSNVVLTYDLSQNFPNPFNPVTEIRYSVPKTEKVKIIIYDLLGRHVKTLVNATVTAGKHVTLWNGTNEIGNAVASGVYFYKLQTKNFTRVKKMMLMK